MSVSVRWGLALLVLAAVMSVGALAGVGALAALLGIVLAFWVLG